MSEWLRALRTDNPLVFRLLILALLLALVLILAHAAWLVWRTVRAARREDAAEAPALIPEPRDAEWYARAADRAAAAGRFAEALQLAFVSLALGLTERVSSSTTRARHRPSAPGTRAWRRRTASGSGKVRNALPARLRRPAGRPGRLPSLRRAAGAEPWHAPAG